MGGCSSAAEQIALPVGTQRGLAVLVDRVAGIAQSLGDLRDQVGGVGEFQPLGQGMVTGGFSRGESPLVRLVGQVPGHIWPATRPRTTRTTEAGRVCCLLSDSAIACLSPDVG